MKTDEARKAFLDASRAFALRPNADTQEAVLATANDLINAIEDYKRERASSKPGFGSVVEASLAQRGTRRTREPLGMQDAEELENGVNHGI